MTLFDPIVTCPKCHQERRMSETPIREIGKIWFLGKNDQPDKKTRRTWQKQGIEVSPPENFDKFLLRIANGETAFWWQCNMCFGHPYLVANPRNQSYRGWDGPVYYYEDRERKCTDCGKDFVFTRFEQRSWYEKQGIDLGVVAAQCKPCRQRRWAQKQLNLLLPLPQDPDEERLEKVIHYFEILENEEKVKYYRKLRANRKERNHE